jgi:periplasmic protein TonB
MRDVYEVLGEKKNAVERLRREVAALRSVAGLVDETATISNVPVQPNVCMEAATETVSRHREALRTAGPLLADEAYDLADRIRAARISSAQPITRSKPNATSRTVIETTRGQTIPTNPSLVSSVFRGPGAAVAVPAKEPPVAGLARSETSSASATNSASVPSLFGLDEQGEEANSGMRHGFFVAIVAIVVIALAAYLSSRNDKKKVDMPASNAAQVQAVPNAAQPTTSAARQLNITRQSPAPNKVSPSTQSAAPERMEEEPMKVKSDLRPAEARAAPADQTSAPAPAPLNLAGTADADDKALSNVVAGAPVTPPKPAPEVLNISQGVIQGLIIKRVQPVYPPQALTMRIVGSVLLQATISRDGSIATVNVISGPGVLGRAAMEAVRQWKYKPYFLNGKPVEIQTQITVNFKVAN